ncbi:TPA: hypothetical protein SMN08_003692 [Proteus mirabilis]|nr:hypothetical protein [Proteus mirabilis]
MTDKTGGAAFPVAYNSETQDAKFGMTLRDYFAAKCISSIISTLNGPVVLEQFKGEFDMYAKQAYIMADAMLKARG